MKKLEREYNTEQLSKKFSYVPALILQNDALSEIILRLPNDECKLVLKELICSDEFTVLLEEIVQNSPQLKKLREKKQAKADVRKQKAAAAEQPVVSGKEYPEQDTASIPNQRDI